MVKGCSIFYEFIYFGLNVFAKLFNIKLRLNCHQSRREFTKKNRDITSFLGLIFRPSIILINDIHLVEGPKLRGRRKRESNKKQNHPLFFQFSIKILQPYFGRGRCSRVMEIWTVHSATTADFFLGGGVGGGGERRERSHSCFKSCNFRNE